MEWDSISEAGGGLAGRVQDTANFWLLAVKNPEATDPVLGLYKVATGTHTLAASKTLTGLGPLTGGSDRYPLRLTFEGNDIMGEIDFSDSSVVVALHERPFLTHTDSTYNTETDVGIWADGVDTLFEEFVFYNWPVGFDALVWDTTPLTSSDTGTGQVIAWIHFNEASNGNIAHPYNSTMTYNNPSEYIDVIDWRCTDFTTDVFIVKIEAVSGDTGDITIYEYGTTLRSFGTWIDLFRPSVYLTAEGSESKSAIIDVTVALDDGTKNPVAGTEVTKQITMNATSTGT